MNYLALHHFSDTNVNKFNAGTRNTGSWNKVVTEVTDEVQSQLDRIRYATILYEAILEIQAHLVKYGVTWLE